jgi:hypothetical protein
MTDVLVSRAPGQDEAVRNYRWNFGAVNAATFVSGISIVYEFTDAENRPTYIGLANTIPGVTSALAPLIGDWPAR